jgi:hypothetical protein
MKGWPVNAGHNIRVGWRGPLVCLFTTLTIVWLLAFAFDLNWQGIVRAVLVLILIIEVVNLAAARPRRRPM